MKKLIALLGLAIVVGGAGCAVQPYGGVSVGVSGEYPNTYYGHGYSHYSYAYPAYPYGHSGYYYKGHYPWHHPYYRDGYYYRY